MRSLIYYILISKSYRSVIAIRKKVNGFSDDTHALELSNTYCEWLYPKACVLGRSERMFYLSKVWRVFVGSRFAFVLTCAL